MEILKRERDLQLQYGGTSNESRNNANILRSKKPPQSTSVAEVHAPLGVKFSAKAFQRAFAESKNIARDGGVQVWMYRIGRALASDTVISHFCQFL